MWFGYLLAVAVGAFLIIEVVGLIRDIKNRKKNKQKGENNE